MDECVEKSKIITDFFQWPGKITKAAKTPYFFKSCVIDSKHEILQMKYTVTISAN